MKKIELNNLPEYSPWITRLLSIEDWIIPSRTIEKINREYEKENYFYDLQECYNRNITNIEDLVHLAKKDKHCVSMGNDLYEMKLEDAIYKFKNIIVDTISNVIEDCNVIVELGAGTGSNLFFLKKRFPENFYHF